MDCRIIIKTEKMKKQITSVSFAKITVFLFMLFTTLVSAQADLPDAPNDTTPGAPIDDYVWVLAVIGLIFVFMKFRAIQNKKIQG
jgi:hypothetical protein